MSEPSRQLLYAQLGFFAFLAVCVAVDDTGVSGNHGFSYYGGRAATIVPYALAFAAAGWFIARAASRVAPAPLATALRVLVALLALDLATPDTIDAAFYWAHVAASTTLFLFELALAAWLARGALSRGLLALQVAGGLVAMFSELQLIAALSVGILVFQLAFGTVLVAATARPVT